MEFVLGSSAAKRAGINPNELKGLGDEGFIIKRIGNKIILSGGEKTKRGTLYAVYEFLETVLGFRWWTPDAMYIPQKPKKIPNQLNKRIVPVFEYREALYINHWEPKWSARNRTNGLWERYGGGVPPEWGGHRKYACFVHTIIGTLIPVELIKKHPEWYAIFDGKPNESQLCLSRDDVFHATMAGIRKILKANPDAEIVSVSQMDNHIYCQCPKCQAIDSRAGSPTGSLLKFVNKVAAALEKEYPHVSVDTLAYLYSRKPPVGIKPRRNVIIRLCTFECDFLHPLSHPNNHTFMRDLKEWARICNRLYIWDYTTNYAHYILPHPNWYVLDKNIRIFRANKVRGVFEQGNQTSLGGEFAEMKSWVLAKLMWNPNLDGKKLIHEFLCGYYGAGASAIERYMERVYKKAIEIKYYAGSNAIRECLRKRGYPECKTGAYLDLNAEPTAPWLTPKVLIDGLEDFEEAIKAAGDDTTIKKRITHARLPLEYAVLLRWDELRKYAKHNERKWLLKPVKKEACNEFIKKCKSAGVTRLGEGWTGRNLQWLKNECCKGKGWK